MGRPWSSSIYHEPTEGDSRQRDVFPLPQLALELPHRGKVCRAVRQRVFSHYEKMRRVNQAINALNSMYFGGSRKFVQSSISDLRLLPDLQKDAIEEIICKVGDLGRPPPACRSEALKVLRAADASGYDVPDVSSGSTVPMDLSSLSLPSGAVAGVELLGALKGPVKGMVENFEEYLLRDAGDWNALADSTASLDPYNDPLLLGRKGYLAFLKKLFDSGVLDFADSCSGRVGAFSVAKKPKVVDGVPIQRQRLVLDCRQTNLLFKPPPQTRLGSLASLAESELSESCDLYISGADIKDCFYAVTMPPGLRRFFALAWDITSDELRHVSGGQLSDDGRVHVPVIKVLPMGFSWSFYLVQHLHTEVSLEALGIDERFLFLEGQPAPVLQDGDRAIMPYCDNLHCISTNQQLCQDGKNVLAEKLEALGFQLHEHAEASTYFETLGGVVDGKQGLIRASHKRMWQLIFAFEAAADSVVSAKTIQRLLGHAMCVCVLNRFGMSVFRKLYDFVAEDGPPRKLSCSERDECLAFAGIVPLLVADIRRPYSDTISCTDASPFGFGICESKSTASTSRSHGRWVERWRFKRLPADQWKPRERSGGWDILSDVRTVVGGLEEHDELDEYIPNDQFPEVPDELMEPSLWRTVKLGKWKHTREHITLKEGRALLIAIRRLSRSKQNRGKRHLFLLDNLSLVFAVAKGRAHSFDLLRILQKISAICLASRLTIRPRWVRSEVNTADGPSRGFFEPGPAPSGEPKKGGSTKGSPEFEPEASSAKDFEADRKETVERTFNREATYQEVEQPKSSSRDSASDAQEETQGEEISSEPEVAGKCWQESPIQSDDHPGEQECQHRSPLAVRGLLEEVRGLLEGERCKSASRCCRGRCSAGRLHGRPVLRQEVPKRRGKDARCFGVFQIRPEGIADEKPPGLERVEKNNASSKQAAYPQAPYVWNCNEAFLQGVQGHGSKGAHRFRPLPPAGGRACLESQEHTSARNGGRGTVQDDHRSDPRLRVRGSRQGGSVRQCTSTRQSRDVLDRGIPFAAEPQAEEPGGPDFSVYHGRVSKAVHGCWEGSWGGGSPPLPAPTWRSISGSEFWLERPQWSEKQRAVEDGPECAPLCKDWQGSAAVDEAIPQHSAVLPVVRGKHGKSFPRNCASSRNVKLSVVHQPFPGIFTMNSRPRRFCIEIFAGAARISTALKNVGLQAFPIDICFFPSHNVLRKDVEFSIQNFLRSGRVEFVWLGMPYTTFSRARRDDGIGPLPLRSSEHIWGLPELNPCQLRKLRDGNALFLFSMRILRLCTELRIPYVIENPETSMAWEVPAMQKFISTTHAKECSLDFCMFGEPWKKPTKLVYNFLSLDALGKKCTSQTHVCSKTHRPHVPLKGVANNGKFMTLLAQPYPWRLAAAFADVVATALRG